MLGVNAEAHDAGEGAAQLLLHDLGHVLYGVAAGEALALLSSARVALMLLKMAPARVARV